MSSEHLVKKRKTTPWHYPSFRRLQSSMCHNQDWCPPFLPPCNWWSTELNNYDGSYGRVQSVLEETQSRPWRRKCRIQQTGNLCECVPIMFNDVVLEMILIIEIDLKLIDPVLGYCSNILNGLVKDYLILSCCLSLNLDTLLYLSLQTSWRLCGPVDEDVWM